MGRGRNGKDSCYVYNDYFIHGIRLSLVQDLKENEGLPFDEILNKYNFNKALTWRWEKSIPKGNKISINKVNIAKQGDEPELVEVPQIVIELTKKYINEKLNDEEIKKELKFELIERGYVMENNNLVMNENNEVKEFEVIFDGGNFNLKSKCKDKKVTLTSRVFRGALSDLPNLKWVKHRNKKIYIGTENGEYLTDYDKVKKFDDVVTSQILYTIDEVVNLVEENDNYTVNLGYLLPISQVSRANKIIESLQNKTFKFETQNGSRVVNIQNVNIIPEGYSTTRLFIEDEKTIDLLSGELLALDFGSRTINAVSLNEGEITNADTLECGSFDLYDAIQNDLKNNKSKDKSIENIAKLYSKNKLEVDDNILTDYLDKIKNELNSYTNDIEDYDNIVIFGGVSKLLSEKKLSDGTILLDKLIEMLGIEKDMVHVLEYSDESNIDGAMLLLNDLIGKVA